MSFQKKYLWIPKTILMEFIETAPENYKLDGKDKLRIIKELTEKDSRMEFLEYFLDEIVLEEAA